MAQGKKELDNFYKQPDPWGYKTNPDDIFRKKKILEILGDNKYENALDVGAGEGWITKDLPAKNLYAYEISDVATKRLPSNVKVYNGEGNMDLVIATGVLYNQYDSEGMAQLIKDTATKHVLICGIKDWLLSYEFGKVLKETEFVYRNYIQRFTLYEIIT